MKVEIPTKCWYCPNAPTLWAPDDAGTLRALCRPCAEFLYAGEVPA